MIKEVRYKNNHIKRFHEHPKNVSLLGSSSFFNDIGSEMITPLLPFYITSLGGGGVAIGLLSGLREGLASIWKILGGWFSDLTGKRKIYIFLGYLVSTLFRFMLLLANSWQHIALFVSLERFGKARDPPRDAIISDSVKKTGHAFGFLQMMDTAGGVIGTFIILFLFWKFNPDLKTIILFASIIGALAILPIFFVYEPTTKKTKKSLFVGIKSLNKDLKYFIFVTTIFTLSNFGLYLFLILRAQELFGNFFIPILMYLFFSISYALFAVPFGNFSDKVGRKKVLFFGYSLFLLLVLGFIYVSNVVLFAVLFSLYGVVYAMTKPVQNAFISDLTNKTKGTAFGFYHFLTGIVTIPAGIIAGFLWDISYNIMFLYLAFVSLIAIVLLIFVKENKTFG